MTRIDDAITAAWHAACAHDGISPDAVFVVFSDDSPHGAEYDKLVEIRQHAPNAFLHAGRWHTESGLWIGYLGPDSYLDYVHSLRDPRERG